MTTKIAGLEVIQRDAQRGSAEYMYKGVRVSKYTQERGHKTKIRGGYSRAGVKFTFHVDFYRAQAIVPTSYRIVKNYTLKETIAEIENFISREDVAVENGKIIHGVSDRDIIRQAVNA